MQKRIVPIILCVLMMFASLPARAASGNDVLTWDMILAEYPDIPIEDSVVSFDPVPYGMLYETCQQSGLTMLLFDTNGRQVRDLDTIIIPGMHAVTAKRNVFDTDWEWIVLTRFVSNDIFPTPTIESGLEIVQFYDGRALFGLVAGSETHHTDAEGLLSCFTIPDGASCSLTSADDTPCTGFDIVGTGTKLHLTASTEAKQDIGIVVLGDVTGTGIVSLTDLVKMAKALSDANVLTGLYALAGDLNGNGRIDLTDVVQEAALLSQTGDNVPSKPAFDPSICDNEQELIRYMTSTTFKDAAGNVMTFKLDSNGQSLSAYINGKLDISGWYYGRQYGGFSMKHSSGARLFCVVNDDGDVEYDFPTGQCVVFMPV